MSEIRDADNTTSKGQRQVGALLAGIFALAGFAFLIFISFAVIRQSGRMDVSDWVMLPLAAIMLIVNAGGFVLIRRGRHVSGAWAVYLVSMIIFPVSATLVLQNVYLVTGLTIVFFTFIFVREVFPVPSRARVIGTAVVALASIFLIELWDPGFRSISDFNAPVFGAILMALAAVVFAVYIMPRVLGGNIRSKIIAGILLTGIVSLGVLSFFALNRTGQLVNTLSDRVETSVNLLAEEQLINTVSAEATRANGAFDSAVSQVADLASQLELLQEQKNTLGNGIYWDAGDRLVRYSNGQYYNSVFSPSSVFVPSTVELNESIINELNVTAYLDFSAPFVIENNSQITAVYYTDTRGIITYYPNIRLGENLLHDYDGTAQPTYRVATPLFNADRLARWSFPRQAPAGTGLAVSVSAPVYFMDEFKGVMTADFQLERIAEQINTIRVGSTGYAFLIDKDGHIIAMPPQGYEFFELEPETLEMNEEPQLTIFDGQAVPFEIRQILSRMVVGGSGLVSTNIGGTDYFMAYTPISDKSFSLGVIVPVAELTQPVIATRNEINSQVQIAIRNATVILLALLAGAILVSLGLGQLIAAPILRLTQTANQILEGDLAAQAEITTRDEIGTLAQAFNAMTARLRATFEGLEKNIEDRTAQLAEANANNERRARQFQSIAQVARTISSTLDLDSLLDQITNAISREFGFYHVGVFLIDTAREYAVLGAANSEGGKIMLERGHRLKVGEKGMVGFVSSTGKPRVALDTGTDAVFFNNPDLPNTRSEIALPLRAGTLIIGVLDVQSTEPNAFTQEDVAILATLADQVSIAIQNARQNEETRKALAESETLSKQFVQTGWQDSTKRRNLLGVQHSGAKATLLYAKSARADDESRQSAGQPGSNRKGSVLSLPVRLRGEVIGSVDVRAPDNRRWDRDELDIVTAIIERAAIAMENARLLAESQKRAAKERAIGEISAKISAQSDVDELLKTAALELNRTLPGAEIAIQFRKEGVE
jgi:GAF domain-containing protein/HAMP domain-containing protein